MNTPMHTMKQASPRKQAEVLLSLAKNCLASPNCENTYAALSEVITWIAREKPKAMGDLWRLNEKLHFPIKEQTFMAILVPIERFAQRNVCESELIPTTDKDRSQPVSDKVPMRLICENLRSAHNLGSIFRLSECFGVEHVHLVGYSATPENPKVLKASLGSESLVPWSYHPTSLEVIEQLRKQGYRIIACETSPHADSLSHKPASAEPVALIVGNEKYGVEQPTLKRADQVMAIDLRGQKNSLNVATATGVFLYEFQKAWPR